MDYIADNGSGSSLEYFQMACSPVCYTTDHVPLPCKGEEIIVHVREGPVARRMNGLAGMQDAGSRAADCRTKMT